MSNIEVGDLVCLYRRKKRGMGIILQQVDDIIAYADVEGESFESVHEQLKEHPNDYKWKAEFRENLMLKSEHPDMVKTCLTYNSSWAKKPKKRFVRIRWFERPSMYETAQIKEIEEWLPQDWVKKL